MKVLRDFKTPAAPATMAGGIMLWEVREGEWATHQYNQEDPSKPPARFWGHYHDDLVDAEIDYHERVLEWLRRYGHTLRG